MVRPAHVKFAAPWQEKLAKFVEHKYVIGCITVLIVLNAITLGLETEPEIYAKHKKFFYIFDHIILAVFTLEIAAKFLAYRFSFFRSGWNVFDLIIVAISWIPTSGAFAVLRALRILRALRLLSIVPQMRHVINALGHSIPGMSSVFGVLCLIFYVCAVLTTKIFGSTPDPLIQDLFGSVGDSTFTLFQLMTLEGWTSEIVGPTMEYHPWSWMFFVPFIIVTSFAVLNLFIGIIVDAMSAVQNGHHTEELEKVDMKTLHYDIKELHKEIARLKAQLDEQEK
ncbi:MAG: ion transporter [Pseudomonadota bacterium]|jgi:voltage-gated sodium channel|nr:ion transporter [Alphaproteobacteria bacterium]MEC7577071.1 ion transporter [Pseudomonadota bacterium]MEC7702063.1 ion transporter [Pseudomonadota bacterium]MEC9234827.1 ion transporter [Pseudomonadota bacterium]MED5422533.1 ion transporter [Pseudomonadota bacterium]